MSHARYSDGATETAKLGSPEGVSQTSHSDGASGITISVKLEDASGAMAARDTQNGVIFEQV